MAAGNGGSFIPRHSLGTSSLSPSLGHPDSISLGMVATCISADGVKPSAATHPWLSYPPRTRRRLPPRRRGSRGAAGAPGGLARARACPCASTDGQGTQHEGEVTKQRACISGSYLGQKGHQEEGRQDHRGHQADGRQAEVSALDATKQKAGTWPRNGPRS